MSKIAILALCCFTVTGYSYEALEEVEKEVVVVETEEPVLEKCNCGGTHSNGGSSADNQGKSK